jgi:hypothetical protein
LLLFVAVVIVVAVEEQSELVSMAVACYLKSAACPDVSRNYLIFKIQGVLRYSLEIHKITKLENHEGKEVTVEELVDQYYKDPDKYIEVNGNSDAPVGGTGTAISNTSIEPEIKNNEIHGVSDECFLNAKNKDK